MTETQFKKIIKVSDQICLCEDYFFNLHVCIHKDHLPPYFNPANESSYRLLGYKGVVNESEPDLEELFTRICNYEGVVEYKATHWLFEDETKGKKLVRKYTTHEDFKDVHILDVYFKNLPIITLYANKDNPTEMPLRNDDLTIIIMPVTI